MTRLCRSGAGAFVRCGHNTGAGLKGVLPQLCSVDALARPRSSLCPISESVVSVDNYRDEKKQFSNEIQLSLARSYGQDVPGGQLT
jgi:hypothetical protein